MVRQTRDSFRARTECTQLYVTFSEFDKGKNVSMASEVDDAMSAFDQGDNSIALF
jgi:hypothetical protein